MKALLLAAGLGTRLWPITQNLPKCLVPIQGEPLLNYWLELLLPNGIEHILVNTHYLAKQVNDFVSRSKWHNRITLINEPKLLGTAGTVLKNRHLLNEGSFFLAHADNLTRFDVPAFMEAHRQRESGIEITMMTFDTLEPKSCGIVKLNNKNIVTHFYEKPSLFYGTKANAAVYIMEPSVITFIASLNKEVVDLSTEVLPHYLGRMQAYHNAKYHRDIGTPESLGIAELEF